MFNSAAETNKPESDAQKTPAHTPQRKPVMLAPRKLPSRFAALSATALFSPLLVVPTIVLARPVVAAPVSPVGAVVMLAGKTVVGTVPYGERTFRPQDRTLSCIIVFSKPSPGTKIRTEWFALNGQKETRFNEQDMVMGQDNGRFSIYTLNKPWPVGKYRVKVFVAGKFDRFVNFSVK